ncbi:hypothetical protein [Psychromonas aquatilis]|uniref:Uncharacterized protein n=1 Tax=Psychromonas aquatilis TaxID=2005072 RepID=A0ABU9GTA8_9GAMM
MKNFAAGFNNFFIGLVSGLLLPIIIILVLLFLSVDKLTGLLESRSFAPIYERSEQTLDKVDTLIMTLDDKVDNADLSNIKALSPLKDANLFPEMKALAASVSELKEGEDNIDKQAVITALKDKLQGSLQGKFTGDQAQQLAESLANIADVIANQDNSTQALKSKAVEELNTVTE